MNERISTNSQVDQFIHSNFHASEMRRLSAMQKQNEVQFPMSGDCNTAVLIPVYFQENRLSETLAQYMNQYTSHPFEVSVLVNGPSDVAIESSQAYIELMGFRQIFPSFPLVVFSTKYQKDELTIGRVRRELAAAMLTRAERSGIALSNFVMISNDADALSIPTNYIHTVRSYFDANEKLAGLTGYCEYPDELVQNVPLIYILQKFMDTMEIIQRYHDSHMVFHGANSSYRATDYMDVGGYRRSRIAEGQDVYKQMKKAHKELQYSRLITINTSPRRQISAYIENVPQASRYDNFGTTEDFSNLYAYTRMTWKDFGQFDMSMMDDFIHVLEHEFCNLWGHKAYSLYARHSRNTDVTFSEVLRFIYEHESQRTEILQNQFIRAASFTGIDLDFVEGYPRFTSVDRLYQRIYNPK